MLADTLAYANRKHRTGEGALHSTKLRTCANRLRRLQVQIVVVRDNVVSNCEDLKAHTLGRIFQVHRPTCDRGSGSAHLRTGIHDACSPRALCQLVDYEGQPGSSCFMARACSDSLSKNWGPSAAKTEFEANQPPTFAHRELNVPSRHLLIWYFLSICRN